MVNDVGGHNHEEQVQEAIRYLHAHRDALARLMNHPGVTMLLDFGCDFPVEQLAGRYYRLPLSLLELCAQFGIEIELSVYATR